MKWFVGLGNPGREYRATRHNVGFMAIDRFAEEWGIGFKESKYKAWIGEGLVEGVKVFLIKPATYMNLSGEAVRAFQQFQKAELTDMTVIYDDLDTEVGNLRLRYQGGAGGHNGIKSIIQHTGTQTFNRIRIGISRPQPGRDIAQYVLSEFTKSDSRLLPDVLEKATQAMHFTLGHPFEQTMAKFNA